MCSHSLEEIIFLRQRPKCRPFGNRKSLLRSMPLKTWVRDSRFIYRYSLVVSWPLSPIPTWTVCFTLVMPSLPPRLSLLLGRTFGFVMFSSFLVITLWRERIRFSPLDSTALVCLSRLLPTSSNTRLRRMVVLPSSLVCFILYMNIEMLIMNRREAWGEGGEQTCWSCKGNRSRWVPRQEDEACRQDWW